MWQLGVWCSWEETWDAPGNRTTTLTFLSFLIIAMLTDVRWHLIVDLTCVSLMISDVEHLFMYRLYVLFENVQVLCSFWLFGFFAFEFLEFFISSRYKSFIRYVIRNYLLLVYNLPFYFFNSVFYRTEGFSLDEVWWINFFFLVWNTVSVL